MNLSAFNVALQGLFPLSPIAVAVQGLIEQVLQEQKVNGSGGAKPVQPQAAKDQLTVEEVIAQWELLEARLRATTPVVEPPQVEVREPQQVPEPRGKDGTLPAPEIALPAPLRATAVPPASAIEREADQTQPDRAQQQRKRQLDEEALLLVLANL